MDSPLGFSSENCKKRHGDGDAVIVTKVQDLSPAASAGLHVGDVILETNGKDTTDTSSLLHSLAEFDTTAELFVHRDGRSNITCFIKLPAAQRMLRDVYNAFDKNGDGTVTFNEIFEKVKKDEDSSFAVLAKDIDANGDHNISWAEFLSCVGPIEDHRIDYVKNQLMPTRVVDIGSDTHVVQLGEVSRTAKDNHTFFHNTNRAVNPVLLSL